MTTNRVTRFAAFMLAVAMTVAINGAVLWKFDNVAHDAGVIYNGQIPAVVTLQTVNIVARES